MSQTDPTISFLSSPEMQVSGLVYLFLILFLKCSSPNAKSYTVPHSQPTTGDNTPQQKTVVAAGARSPTEAAPPAPSPYPLSTLLPLEVEGYHTAVHVTPPKPPNKVPSPVTVVLHGNYDRPEWQCATWRHVAGFRGWVVCPRGIPTPWAEPSADRWMYRGSAKTQKEIEAVIHALKSRYPGLVDDSEMVLAGFSLGAILAPAIAISQPNRYTTLFLIEGGVDKIDKRRIRALKRSGVRSMGLAMSSRNYRNTAKQLVSILEKMGLKSVFVDMAGAGHDYHPDFGETGRKALKRLLEP
jgi:predicted esterase